MAAMVGEIAFDPVRADNDHKSSVTHKFQKLEEQAAADIVEVGCPA